MVINSEIHNLFTSQVIKDNVVVPTLLLKNYKQLGLDDIQIIIILNLLAIGEDQNLDEIIQQLSIKMSSNKEIIKQGLALLIERNILTIDGKLQLDKLFAMIFKLWQQHNSASELVAATYDEASSLYTTFEQEFGRLLTPMEGDQIKDWVESEKYEYSLIKGALKRSVLRGILNFKYIDSILREWRRKNFRTINDVIAYENQLDNKGSNYKNTKKTKTTNSDEKMFNKYKDIYMG